MNRIFIVWLLLLQPVYLRAVRFDCSKAHTRVEKALCSSRELSAADDKLDQSYQAALTKVPEAAMLVRESQRKWLLSVAHRCSLVDANLTFSQCLVGEWTDRTGFLGHIVVRMGGVPFFLREIRLDKPCDEEDMATDLGKTSPRSHKSDDANSDDGSCAIHATWPEAVSNAPKWQAWNKALLDEARRFNASQDSDEQVPNHWVRFADTVWHFPEVDISVELVCVSPTLVSTTINRYYTYAHPAHEERAFNWLLEQNRELKQDDLFQPNSAWEAWMKKRVAQIVKEYEISTLKSEPSDAEEIAVSAARVAIQPRYWQIDGKGINLIFTQEELGYLTALDMPDITLPWSDLKPYLNPTFEIPQ
jgi:uncharacterized protein YecT (DUF1311 family)